MSEQTSRLALLKNRVELSNELEDARVALIQKLTDEENELRKSVDEMRREVASLNTERSGLIAKLRYKESDKIGEQITKLQSEIKVAEESMKAIRIKQEDARQCRAPELANLQRKVELAMTAERQGAAKHAEEAFLALITDEIRDAARKLSLASNETHASLVALHALTL